MRLGLGTAFWSLLLAGAALAIAVGFASGRTYGTTALRLPPPPLREVAPPAMQRRELARALVGTKSLAAGDDDPDPSGDPERAFVPRPAGWAPPAFDERHGRARVAVIVVGADRAASTLAAFAAEPFPLAVLVAPDAAGEALRVARAAGKTALIACERADPAAIAVLRRAGAAGIACSTADAARADALLVANRNGVVVDDLLRGDALYRAARAAHVHALTRDVVADARDADRYVEFLLAQALAIARRSGVAAVAVHARPSSLRALERFAIRAERSGATLVDIASIAG
ncbi:MAG: hypothetical protein NVS3B7_04380 [Candidatus Elarobacter sp.]